MGDEEPMRERAPERHACDHRPVGLVDVVGRSFADAKCPEQPEGGEIVDQEGGAALAGSEQVAARALEAIDGQPFRVGGEIVAARARSVLVDLADELLLIRIEGSRVRPTELADAIEQLGPAERPAPDRDAPDADVLLRREEKAAP
jgi:hypothetical protein